MSQGPQNPPSPILYTNGQAEEIFDKAIDYADGSLVKADSKVNQLWNATMRDFEGEISLPDMIDDGIGFDEAMELYNAMAGLLPPAIDPGTSDIPEPVESFTIPGMGVVPSAPSDPSYSPPELGAFVTEPPTVTITAPTLNPIDPVLNEPDYTPPTLVANTISPPEEPIYAVPDDTTNIEALLDLAVTHLTSDMTDGTYGMDSTQETLMWERAKERERLEYEAAIEEVDTFAVSGFSKPPGAMNKALEKAQQQYFSKLATINRDQVSKRADLHFEARQKAFASAIQLKTAIEDINKVLAQIYETRVRAYLGRIEAYKTEETLKMESYKASLSGFESQVRAFLGKVDANSKNEMLKVESFKAELGMYETREKIYLGQIEAYKTNETLKIENFKALLGMYETQQRLYLGKIEAFKSENQFRIDILKAEIDAYDSRVKAYLGKTEVFKTEEMLKVEGYKAELAAFEAQMKGLAEVFRLSQEAQAEEYKVQLNALQQNTEIAKLSLTGVMKEADMKIEAGKSIADVYKAIVASALSIIHTSANTSASLSTQSSSSWQSQDADNYNVTMSGKV